MCASRFAVFALFQIAFKVRELMKNFEGSIALVLSKSSKFTIQFVGSKRQLSQVFDPSLISDRKNHKKKLLTTKIITVSCSLCFFILVSNWFCSLNSKMINIPEVYSCVHSFLSFTVKDQQPTLSAHH